MFEVGKKYQYLSYERIYECVWTDGKQAALKNNTAFLVMSSDYHFYKEFVEPAVEKVVREVHKNLYSNGYYTAVEGEFSNHLGKFELTITDGKLTGVAII